jgi:hypothetical protein
MTFHLTVRKLVVQDTWNEEDDQDLLDLILASKVPYQMCSARDIIESYLSDHHDGDPSCMIFANSSMIQQLLKPSLIVNTYLPCFQEQLYRCKICRGILVVGDPPRH